LAGAQGLDPVQRAFADCGALQCGFCQPGMMLSARALLDKNPTPTLPQIQEALSGNLCRCTGYTKIYEAVQVAAGLRAPAQRLPALSERAAPSDSKAPAVKEVVPRASGLDSPSRTGWSRRTVPASTPTNSLSR